MGISPTNAPRTTNSPFPLSPLCVPTQNPAEAPARCYAVLLSWCISRNLLTQCCRTPSGILQNTMALCSLLSTFSEILTCRSSSSLEKSPKKMSRACSRHRGAPRVLRASSSSSTMDTWSRGCCGDSRGWLVSTAEFRSGVVIDANSFLEDVRRRF